ncbi:MAG: DEAD/DEAH box helicase [Plesiomonas shigelloides]
MARKKPRYYQLEAMNSLLQAIRKAIGSGKSGRFVIDAAPATGKTLTMAMIAESVSSKGGSVLILSYQPVLCGQNYDECWEYQVPACMYASKFGKKQVNGNVVVATVGTIVNALETDFKNTRFDIILIDECHQVPFDEPRSQYMQVIDHFAKNAVRIGSKRPLQIGGMSGSPYRGIQSIVGEFWDEIVYNIGIEKATEEGYLTAPIYGYPGNDEDGYDFSQIETMRNSWEFSEEDLDRIVMSGEGKERLVRIMTEVKAKTLDRNQIIIFASTKRHASEARDVLLALGEKEDSIGLVTDDTPERERDAAIDKSKAGELRWLINVSCLTTGFDSPLIDTVLFLRPVGSLTLLLQCLGRAARLLKDWMIEKGYSKPNYLVLDYAGVFDRLGHLLESPIISDAELAKDKQDEKPTQFCPVCHEENSLKARRCRGKDKSEPDGRCGHFFGKFVLCPSCQTKNDTTAQVCRNPCCKRELIDPNRKLLNKAYSDDEMRKVSKMIMEPCKNGALKVTYQLKEMPEHGHPHEIFYGLHSQGAKRIFEVKFVNPHIQSFGWKSKVMGMSTAEQICRMRDAFKSPTYIAYRINDKKQFVIGRRWFGGAEEM